jgi:cell division protein ZapA
MNMAQKTEAQVTIGGKTYTLSGYESEEYILKVAEYLNGKIDELTADSEYAKIPTDMRQLLLNLNIADDYFKMKAQNEELAALIDKKDNELYDIKHDLVAAQMKLGQAVDGGKSGKLSAK